MVNKRIFSIVLWAVLGGVLISFFVQQTVWVQYYHTAHILFEYCCVFIALMIFVVMWYTYEQKPDIGQVLGPVFLIIAVYNLFHILAETNFIVLVRLMEVTVFLIITTQCNINMNKWPVLILSILFAFGSAGFIAHYPNLLSSYFYNNNMIPAGFIFIFLILLGTTFSIYNIRDKLQQRDKVTYRYILIALVISVISNFSFVLSQTANSLFNIQAHILRIIYYYFLFKGIFVSAVVYPHEKMERFNRDMNEILHNLPVALSIYDADYKMFFVNKKAQSLFGHESKELVGLNDQEILKKIYENETQHIIRKLSKEHMVIKNHLCNFKNSWGNSVKISIDAYRLANGGSICFFDEAQKVQALDYMQLQTQTIVNSISNPLLLFDKNNKALLCNKACTDFIERDARDIIGENMEDFEKLINMNTPEEDYKCLIGANAGSVFQASFTSSSGCEKELLVQKTSITNIDGDVIGSIIIGTDVTFMKKEQQRFQQNEKLVVLGQMATGIVHEIRNPLTAIKGFSQIITYICHDNKINECAHLINKETDRLNKVVTDFLKFAKPRIPVLEKVPINEIIRSLHMMIETNSYVKNINLTITLHEEDKIVWVDAEQIKQVILNIVQNAMEAMSDLEKPELSISTGYSSVSDEVYVKISDNGKGMSEEDIIRVGTPFFTTKDNGTGLGLSICYQIVKEHRGRIEIESELGCGTSFVIFLPRCNDNKIRIA